MDLYGAGISGKVFETEKGRAAIDKFKKLLDRVLGDPHYEERKARLLGIPIIQKPPLTVSLHENTYNRLLIYFKSNIGKALTVKALLRRMDEICKFPDENEFCRENLQDLLNRLRVDGWISSEQHGDDTFYFRRG